MKKIYVVAIAGIFILSALTGCIKKDDEAPYIKVYVSGTAHNGWYRSNVTVTMDAGDNGSGLKEFKWRLDGDYWRDYEGKIKITDNGIHLLEYYAKDKRGNMESGNITIRIDKTKPKITFNNFEPGFLYLKGKKYPVLRIPKDTMIVGKMGLEVNASDKPSGIARVEFYVGGNMVANISKEPYVWNVNKTIGVYNITAIAYDIAGNSASITVPEVQFFVPL